VKSLPSYIQDTTDFLSKLLSIKQRLLAGCILFCLDVKSLCPSVPRQKARAAAEVVLPGLVNPLFPTDDVPAMMDAVLDYNTFDGVHYVQTEVTVIGSHLGMNYALTYMGP